MYGELELFGNQFVTFKLLSKYGVEGFAAHEGE